MMDPCMSLGDTSVMLRPGQEEAMKHTKLSCFNTESGKNLHVLFFPNTRDYPRGLAHTSFTLSSSSGAHVALPVPCRHNTIIHFLG